MVITLALATFVLLIYNIFLPGHLGAHLEMQHCGGCHSEEATIRMHEYADPLEKECIECHTDAMTGLSVHAEMIPDECDRCHQFGDRPAFSDCILCHGNHYHIESGINTGEQPCNNCHASHSLLTDRGCAKCHRDEYNFLKNSGDKHSERPDSCYTCHIEHKYIPRCLDCHEEMIHGEEILLNCTECHQQHSPRALNFSPVVTPEECNICHPEIVQHFQENPSKHSEIYCVTCHEKHQRWRDCRECHVEVHKDFTEFNVERCIGCHRDPHSPVRYVLQKGTF